jgi:hypothetical protein
VECIGINNILKEIKMLDLTTLTTTTLRELEFSLYCEFAFVSLTNNPEYRLTAFQNYEKILDELERRGLEVKDYSNDVDNWITVLPNPFVE